MGEVSVIDGTDRLLALCVQAAEFLQLRSLNEPLRVELERQFPSPGEWSNEVEELSTVLAQHTRHLLLSPACDASAGFEISLLKLNSIAGPEGRYRGMVRYLMSPASTPRWQVADDHTCDGS